MSLHAETPAPAAPAEVEADVEIDVEAALEVGAEVGAEAPGGFGRVMFDRRRWIIPPFVLAAFALGGAAPAGRAAGAALLGAALVLHVAACRHIGGASRVHARKAARRRELVTTGPFGRLRNPIYLGNAFAAAGMCLAMGPAWFAAVTLLAVLLAYDRVVAWEEALLASLYGEAYARYRRSVPRWLPIGRAASTDPAASPPHPLGKVLRRERGTFVLVAFATVLAVLRPWLGGPLL